MTTLDVDGQLIGYAEAGEGAPMLLLHGTTMSRTAFDLVRAAMPEGAAYRFVMMDLPGSGESPRSRTPLSVEELATQADAVMRHAGHESFHVAGFSLGAVVAAALAALHPSKVRSATLIAGWAVTDASMLATFGLWRRLLAAGPQLFVRYALVHGFSAAAVAAMEPMFEAAVAMGAENVAPGSIDQIELDELIDISAMLPRIVASTLVIGGTHDQWVDIGHARALVELIPGAQMEEVPTGHMMMVEAAAPVAALLHAHASAH